MSKRAGFGSASWHFLPYFIDYKSATLSQPNTSEVWHCGATKRTWSETYIISVTKNFLTLLSSFRLSSQLPVFAPQNQSPSKERKLSSEKERLNESTSSHTNSWGRGIPEFHISVLETPGHPTHHFLNDYKERELSKEQYMLTVLK